MIKLLREYIRAIVAEERDARVPQQLISPDSLDDEDKEQETQEVSEFSGTGGVAGYTAPLGFSAKEMHKKKK